MASGHAQPAPCRQRDHHRTGGEPDRGTRDDRGACHRASGNHHRSRRPRLLCGRRPAPAQEHDQGRMAAASARSSTACSTRCGSCAGRSSQRCTGWPTAVAARSPSVATSLSRPTMPCSASRKRWSVCPPAVVRRRCCHACCLWAECPADAHDRGSQSPQRRRTGSAWLMNCYSRGRVDECGAAHRGADCEQLADSGPGGQAGGAHGRGRADRTGRRNHDGQAHWRSVVHPDRVEGIRAFNEGREPTFPDPDF